MGEFGGIRDAFYRKIVGFWLQLIWLKLLFVIRARHKHNDNCICKSQEPDTRLPDAHVYLNLHFRIRRKGPVRNTSRNNFIFVIKTHGHESWEKEDSLECTSHKFCPRPSNSYYWYTNWQIRGGGGLGVGIYVPPFFVSMNIYHRPMCA